VEIFFLSFLDVFENSCFFKALCPLKEWQKRMAEKAAKGPKIPKIPKILREGEILTVIELRYVYLKVIHNEGFENFLTVTYI